MRLEFFDTGGEIVKTGSRTVKCATGYNLAGLMTGSEGTSGVFSGIILKLIPPPQSRKSMVAISDSMADASETVAGIVAIRIISATLEFMGNFTIRAVEDYTHAGDGNLHPTILTDRRDRTEWKRVKAAIEDIFHNALKLGGPLSGEHGIGIAKFGFMEKETTAATITCSRKIRKALDPEGILNPGKIIG